MDEVVANASEEVLEACGDNVECIFDASQTGNISIGLETRQVEENNQMDQAISCNFNLQQNSLGRKNIIASVKSNLGKMLL